MFSIQQKTDYGYSGHRWVTEHESPTLDISRFYEWSDDVNGWAMTTYDKIHKDENGNVNLRELYTSPSTWRLRRLPSRPSGSMRLPA